MLLSNKLGCCVEKVISIVKAYHVDGASTLVVVIPKDARDELHIKKGNKFIVKIDDKSRIVYEPIK